MIGHIDSIETLGLVDGPGIRVVVFLQGCPLRCVFCHNPETWTLNDKFLITPDDLVRHIYKYRNYFGTDVPDIHFERNGWVSDDMFQKI